METLGCMGLIVGIVIMFCSALWLWGLAVEAGQDEDESWNPIDHIPSGGGIYRNIRREIIRRPTKAAIPLLIFLLGLGLFMLCWSALPTDENVKLTPAPREGWMP